MDTLLDDFVRTDVDTQLTHEDITEQDLYLSDEVEDLQNSLREAVHDETVRPKMQCLMMDSSFSMVTMQGEDSGIEWETNTSRCTTPWASEAGNPPLEFSSPIAMRPATPGSLPAGRIIVVMDEELMSRRKKTKKSKVDRQRETLLEDADGISGRPELMGVSLPNVKTEGDGDEEEATDPLVDKEQRLFRLVSEGSEILNIVVPPKLATVDEEESKVMVDNLSYLEEVPVFKSSRETDDTVFDLNDEVEISTQALTASGVNRGEQVSHPIGPHVMDPPGAPVARPPGRGPVGNVDYFEKFTLIDAQAPGSPAVTTQGQQQPQADATMQVQDTEEPVQPKENNTTVTATVDKESTAAVSGEEISSELLDEVFYGGTDDHLMKSFLDRDEGEAGEGAPKSPLKESGSALFGSQEDILTPIFLPEGPPKIIDLILLEEPKAMAFLYTDLYEEAVGSRQKEEDTESLTSEKSFHSRHSDREARGYLEKYVLKDETPMVEMEPADIEQCQDEGMRMLSQDSYDFCDVSTPEKGETANIEEITDFFRSSANSSPCDIEPFPQLQDENDTQAKTKNEAKTNKTITAANMFPPTKTTAKAKAETPAEPLEDSSYEFFSEEADWGGALALDHPSALDRTGDRGPTDQDLEMPIAPPRRKAVSPPKTSLDLTPLTPVDGIEESGEGAGGKEQRVEEKETASPAETADEGDGDGQETRRVSSGAAALPQHASDTEATKARGIETVADNSNETTKTTLAEVNDAEAVTEERSETDAAKKQSGPDEFDTKPDKQGESLTDSTRKGESKPPPEPAKGNGQCIIL